MLRLIAICLILFFCVSASWGKLVAPCACKKKKVFVKEEPYVKAFTYKGLDDTYIGIMIDSGKKTFKGAIEYYASMGYRYNDGPHYLNRLLNKQKVDLDAGEVSLFRFKKNPLANRYSIRILDRNGKEIKTLGADNRLNQCFVIGHYDHELCRKITLFTRYTNFGYLSLKNLPANYAEYFGHTLFLGTNEIGMLTTKQLAEMKKYIDTGGQLYIYDNSAEQLPEQVKEFLPNFTFYQKKARLPVAFLQALSGSLIDNKIELPTYRQVETSCQNYDPVRLKYFFQKGKGCISYLSYNPFELKLDDINLLHGIWGRDNRHNRSFYDVNPADITGYSRESSFIGDLSLAINTPFNRLIFIFLFCYSAIHIALFLLIPPKKKGQRIWLFGSWGAAGMFCLFFSYFVFSNSENDTTLEYCEYQSHLPDSDDVYIYSSMVFSSKIPDTVQWRWKNKPEFIMRPIAAAGYGYNSVKREQAMASGKLKLSSMGNSCLFLSKMEKKVSVIDHDLKLNLSDLSVSGYIHNKKANAIGPVVLIFSLKDFFCKSKKDSIFRSGEHRTFFLSFKRIGGKEKISLNKKPLKLESSLTDFVDRNRYIINHIQWEYYRQQAIEKKYRACLIYFQRKPDLLPHFNTPVKVTKHCAVINELNVDFSYDIDSEVTTDYNFKRIWDNKKDNKQTDKLRYIDDDIKAIRQLSVREETLYNASTLVKARYNPVYLPQDVVRADISFSYKIYPSISVTKDNNTAHGALILKVLNLKTGKWDPLYSVSSENEKKRMTNELVERLNTLRLKPKKSKLISSAAAKALWAFGAPKVDTVFDKKDSSKTVQMQLADMGFKDISLQLKNPENYIEDNTNKMTLLFQYDDTMSKIRLIDPRVNYKW